MGGDRESFLPSSTPHGGMSLRHHPRHAGDSFSVPPPDPLYDSLVAPPAAPLASLAVPAEMAEEAAEARAPAEAWWLARSAGATLEQARDLASCGERALLTAAIATRLGLASCEEVADAAGSVDPFAYLTTREAGFAHDEALLVATGDAVAFTAIATRFGRSEALAALAAGMAPADYAAFRRFADHDQALQAHGAGVAATDYVLAASSGASHDEVLDAVAKRVDLWAYARRRNLGSTHDEATRAPARAG